ncbi:MAG: adenylate/guanylate cyclase domain-containing protein [Spirochaetes bacterium]|jgi:adenylate cyclase|nr:adenylate/guanylate cyclase domain-containing protein [Spirochaetota bacterium]
MKKTDSAIFSKKKALIGIASILTILFSLLYASLGTYFYNKTYDFMVKTVGGKIHTPHEDVVLLLIDQTSIIWGEELQLGRWPWPRNIYSDIITYINEVNPPKAIFFDIMLSARDTSDMSNDTLLAETIAWNQNVFHNVFFSDNDELQSGMKMPEDVAQHYSIEIKNATAELFSGDNYNEVELPLPCLRADVDCNTRQSDEIKEKPTAMGISIVTTVFPDPDGIYRRSKPVSKYGDKYYPSMALSAILAYQNLPNQIQYTDNNTLIVGDYNIPLGSEGNYLINYHADERIQNYSMSWLLDSAIDYYGGSTNEIKLPPGSFKDKIVIIGVSAPAGQDLKNTPVSQNTPGPEIQANMISNILQGNHIIRSSGANAFITSLILMLITVFIVVYSSNPLVKIASNIVIYSVYGLVTALIFHKTNYLMHTFFGLTTGIIATTGSYMFLSVTEGAERRRYSKILSSMIDPTIVNEALNDLEALKKGGEKRITAFFSDVASFSTISEKLTSGELAALLNEYLSAMTGILKNNHGTLDKYIGDAIVGIFGAPVTYKETAINACRASIQMHQELKLLHEKWIRDHSYCEEARSMQFRIGLNTGIAKVGFMGTNELASYTMMGDTVNLAARLESAGKDYGVNTLISQYTYKEVKKEMVTRLLDKVRVKGKEKPVSIYELIGEQGAVPQETLDFVALYEEGFNLYQNRQWLRAAKTFTRAKKMTNNTDKACALLIARCSYYHKRTPPPAWDGVFTRTHK